MTNSQTLVWITLMIGGDKSLAECSHAQWPILPYIRIAVQNTTEMWLSKVLYLTMGKLLVRFRKPILE